MPTTIANTLGRITIADEVIATTAGIAALDCYGLADMSPRKGVRDSLSGMLGRENPGRGVEVKTYPDGFTIELSIIVSYGTRIPQVAENLREKVGYTLQDSLGLVPDKINISVQGVRVVDER